MLVRDPGSWMHRGSYLVACQIQVRLENWFEDPGHAWDAVIGRRTSDGVPLGERVEHDPVDLDLRKPGGAPYISPHGPTSGPVPRLARPTSAVASSPVP